MAADSSYSAFSFQMIVSQSNCRRSLFPEVDSVTKLTNHQCHTVAPFNVYAMLSMLTMGLSGKAYKEMEAVLGVFINEPAVQRNMNLIIAQFLPSSFIMSTFLLVEHHLSLNVTFRNRACSLYHADILAFNASTPEANTKNVNEKLRNKTQCFRSQAISSEVFTDKSQFILLNTVRLNVSWYRSFRKEDTKLGTFTVRDAVSGTKVYSVAMMYLRAHLPYVDYGTFSAIDLRLWGNGEKSGRGDHPFWGDYVMTILLPKPNTTLTMMSNNLQWESFLPNHYRYKNFRYLNLWLPRFNVSASLSLKAPLREMGVNTLFSGIAQESLLTSPLPGKSIKIDEIVQQVKLEVNEVGLCDCCSKSQLVNDYKKRENPIAVRVNRPFLYLVWHPSTQLVLFSGSVSNPKVL